MRTMLTTAEMFRIDNSHLPPHYDSFEQNRWMTTPIAYASQLPYDVFADYTAGAERTGFTDYGFSETHGCPHYQTYGKSYWIVSVGPDMHWQTMWKVGMEDKNVRYDMSNGLRSEGDMYVINGSFTAPIKH